MSTWFTVQSKPVEPVAGQAPPRTEFWQLCVTKEPARAYDGLVIRCQWRDQEGLRAQAYGLERALVATSPVGTVFYTFQGVGPLGGTVSIAIDRYGGLQAHLHYPTLPGPYQLDML